MSGIGAMLPYFGGKRTIAPVIVEELGAHRAYFELFAGSAAVLFAKPPSAMETVNDLYGPATNLACVLASDRCADLWERVRRTPMAEALVDEGRGWMGAGDSPSDCGGWAGSVGEVGPEHVELAFWTLVVSWQGRNGTIGTASYNHSIARRFTASGGDPATRWRRVAQAIPEWHERLRSAVVTRMDAVELASRIEDKPHVSVYADPPYLEKGAKYVHDFKAEDHERLAEALRRFERARVVVSYYDDPRLDALYPGWTKVRVAATKALTNQGARDKGGAVKAPEVLLVNGPSRTMAVGMFAEGASA